jgi:hypothetical protein
MLLALILVQLDWQDIPKEGNATNEEFICIVAFLERYQKLKIFAYICIGYLA